MLIGVFDKIDPLNHSFVTDFFVSNGVKIDDQVYLISEGYPDDAPYRREKSVVLPSLFRRRGIRRYLNFFQLLFLLRRLTRSYDGKVRVLVRNCPILLGSSIMCRVLGVEVYYQNSFPHELFLSRLPRILLLFYFRLVQFGLSGCIGVSPLALNRLRHCFPRVKRYLFIPLCVGRDVLTLPIPARNEVDSDSKKKFCYVGSLDQSRQFSLVLLAFQSALNEGMDAELHIYGGTDKELVAFKAFSKEIGVASWVFFHGRVPRQNLLKQISKYDAGLSLFPEGPMFKEASPTKLIEYMSVGLPVIASLGCALQEDAVRESGAGILVDFSCLGIKEGFLRIHKYTAQERVDASYKGIDFVSRKYTYDKFVPSFIKFIKQDSSTDTNPC